MKTKLKTFDPVEMSRLLREDTSRKLNSMSREERLACLRQTRERLVPGGRPAPHPVKFQELTPPRNLEKTVGR